MAKYAEGTGKFGVQVKYSGGGTSTFYFETKSERNTNFNRIKREVTSKDKVTKKDR